MSSKKRSILLYSATVIVPLLLAGCSNDSGSLSDMEQGSFAGASAHELGVYHFQQGHYGLAIQHFERSAKLDQSMVESLNGLGASYDQLGRFDLAENYYRRALRLDPQSAQTLNNMGYSYWMQDKHDLALAFLRDADRLDQGNRLIAANKALASASLQENDTDWEIDQLAALEKATAEVEEPAFTTKRGARLERTSVYEQHLVLRGGAVPAAFAGLPDIAEDNPFQTKESWSGASDATPLPLTYLADQTALQVPASETDEVSSSSLEVSEPLETAAAPEPVLERSQLAVVPLVAVEATALAELETPAPETPAAETPAAETSVLETQVQESRIAADLETTVIEPVAAEAPVDEAAPTSIEMAAVDDEAAGLEEETSGFFANLMAGFAAFFTADETPGEAFVASTGTVNTSPTSWEAPAYVGPYGTEAGGRHPSLGPVQRDQYAATHPRIEVSDVSGQAGTATRVGAYLEGRGLPVDEPMAQSHIFNSQVPNGQSAQLAAKQPVTTIYFSEGWAAYASGLAATLPTNVELQPTTREGVDISIEVGADLVDFDRDSTAANNSRLDDISG